MDDLNSKLNVIDKVIKQCEQSKLVSFAYQDAMLAIQFSKVKEEEDQSTNVIQKLTMEKDSDLKIGNMNIDLNECAITDISQIDEKENEDKDIITIVSPFVGTVEFSTQIKLGGNNIYINKGDVICSVEAMKIYNDIKAPASGTIVEMLVKDCSLLEYEQPILKIRCDKNE